MVIELDGSQHYEEKAVEYDKQRTAFLRSLGLTVLRFTNIEVDRNFEGVCKSIEQAILSQAEPDCSFQKEPYTLV